jgi:hypothetical protein
MYIAYVKLGVHMVKPRMETIRTSRYRVHERRPRRSRYPKSGVKKKTCKVMVDRIEKSYGA